MQEQTFFEEKVWAPLQSGWMTIYSFRSPGLICLDTTSCTQNGASKYRRMAAAGRRAATYGTGERRYRAATWRSSTRIAPHPSKTCLPTPHAPQRIKDLHMQMPILTGCQHVWVSNGRHPSRCPLDRKSLIWAFSGTYMRGRCTSQMRKNSSISPPSLIGAENAHMTFSRCKNSMASCCTWCWSSLQDELTSPAWRPCSPLFTTVLLSHIPLPKIPQTTWPGGSSSLAMPASSPPLLNPNPSSTTGPIRTQALVSAWLSRLAHNGVHGALPPSGSLKEETSSGPKPLASSSWSSAFVNYQRRAITSSSIETIVGSSRDGGKSVAPTGLQTSSSIISSNFQRIVAERYTRGMSQAHRTQLMAPPTPFSSTQSSSQGRPGLSLSTFDAGEIARKVAAKNLVRQRSPGAEGVESSDDTPRAPKQRKVLEARARNLPIPPPNPSATKGPAPYPQHLTPTPSHLHPHCLAKDRLRLWSPTSRVSVPNGSLTVNEVEHVCVMEIMLHAWEEDTRVAYGAGLLMWHCFCDEKGTSEEARAPVAQSLISTFIAHLVATYSGRTISGYLSGVRAWHMLHGLLWVLKNCEMDVMLWVANKLMPSSLKKKKCCLYTPDFILAVCYITVGTFARHGLGSKATTLRSLSGVRGSEY